MNLLANSLKILWSIELCVLFVHNYIYRYCFANYGASEALNLCIVCGEICQPLDAKMRQLF